MRVLRSKLFDDVWAKMSWSTLLALVVICLFVAPLYESRDLIIQAASGVAFIFFWVGSAWAHIWTNLEMQKVFSHPLHLIDKSGNLHPLMKVGHHYGVVSYTNPWGVSGDRLYVLRDLRTDADAVIFCAYTSGDFVFPATAFQVVQKTEDRGKAAPKKISFVFE